jgi:hypothetical protein
MLLALRNLPVTADVFTGREFYVIDEDESLGPPRKAPRTDTSDDISSSRKDTTQQDEYEDVPCRNLRVLNLQGRQFVNEAVP